MNKALNYQDVLLNAVRKECVPVTIFLASGFQLKCVIKAFDSYVVMIEAEGRQQMVYKHAISTIALSRNIKIDYTLESIDEK